MNKTSSTHLSGSQFSFAGITKKKETILILHFCAVLPLLVWPDERFSFHKMKGVPLCSRMLFFYHKLKGVPLWSLMLLFFFTINSKVCLYAVECFVFTIN